MKEGIILQQKEAVKPNSEKELLLEIKLKEQGAENENLKNKLEDKDKLIKDLENKIKDRDKLFLSIAHDLRSPFQSILGMSKLLEEEIEMMSEEEIIIAIKAINKSSESAFNLTEEILLWGTNQIKGIEVMNQNINLGSLVKDVIYKLETQTQNKKINIINNIKEHTPVFADVGILNSILLNILSNAIKFNKVGGSISISIENNEVIISDNGIGISKERQNNFFDNIGNTSRGTKGEKGIGLGMNLSKDYVIKMGGKIRVESDGEDKGSTFIVTLPENKNMLNK